MDLKEFLKPTKGKIILTVIFSTILIYFLFLFTFGVVNAPNIVAPPYVGCCIESAVNLNPDFNCTAFHEEVGPEVFNLLCDEQIKYQEIKEQREISKRNKLIQFSLIAILISYLTSCILILTYKKVVKK